MNSAVAGHFPLVYTVVMHRDLLITCLVTGNKDNLSLFWMTVTVTGVSHVLHTNCVQCTAVLCPTVEAELQNNGSGEAWLQ